MPSILRGLVLFPLSWVLLPNPCIVASQQAQPLHKPTASKSATASADQADQKDEKILNKVSNAASQADSLTDGWMFDLFKRGQNNADARKLAALSDQIDNDRKIESHWEQSIWTIPNSELLPGESIRQHLGTFLMVEGTGSTMRLRLPECRTNQEDCGSVSDTATIGYVVQAPLDIKARIMVEKLRQAISHYSAIQQLRGETDNDDHVTSWNTAWFDARNVYCRRSPGEKYRDLLGEEQVCK